MGLLHSKETTPNDEHKKVVMKCLMEVFHVFVDNMRDRKDYRQKNLPFSEIRRFEDEDDWEKYYKKHKQYLDRVYEILEQKKYLKIIKNNERLIIEVELKSSEGTEEVGFVGNEQTVEQDDLKTSTASGTDCSRETIGLDGGSTEECTTEDVETKEEEIEGFVVACELSIGSTENSVEASESKEASPVKWVTEGTEQIHLESSSNLMQSTVELHSWEVQRNPKEQPIGFQILQLSPSSRCILNTENAMSMKRFRNESQEQSDNVIWIPNQTILLLNSIEDATSNDRDKKVVIKGLMEVFYVFVDNMKNKKNGARMKFHDILSSRDNWDNYYNEHKEYLDRVYEVLKRGKYFKIVTKDEKSTIEVELKRKSSVETEEIEMGMVGLVGNEKAIEELQDALETLNTSQKTIEMSTTTESMERPFSSDASVLCSFGSSGTQLNLALRRIAKGSIHLSDGLLSYRGYQSTVSIADVPPLRLPTCPSRWRFFFVISELTIIELMKQEHKTLATSRDETLLNDTPTRSRDDTSSLQSTECSESFKKDEEVESMVETVSDGVCADEKSEDHRIGMFSLFNSLIQELERDKPEYTTDLVNNEVTEDFQIKYEDMLKDNTNLSSTWESSAAVEEMRVKVNEVEERLGENVSEMEEEEDEPNREYEERLREQKEKHSEAMRKMKEERERVKAEFEKKIEERREKSRQCLATFLQCIVMKQVFAEKEEEWSRWIESSCRQPLIRIIGKIHDLQEELVERTRNVHRTDEDETRKEMVGTSCEITSIVDSFSDIFDGLGRMGSEHCDKLFIRVLRKSLCDVAVKLIGISEQLEVRELSAEWNSELNRRVSDLRSADIPSTKTLRYICQRASPSNYENLKFPEQEQQCQVVIEEISEDLDNQKNAEMTSKQEHWSSSASENNLDTDTEGSSINSSLSSSYSEEDDVGERKQGRSEDVREVSDRIRKETSQTFMKKHK